MIHRAGRCLWVAVLSPALLIALAGCTPTEKRLSPGGERVRVVEEHQVRDCEALGTVTASASSLMGSVTESRRLNARNKAAAKGGNRIVLATADFYLGTRRNYRVYRCPEGS